MPNPSPRGEQIRKTSFSTFSNGACRSALSSVYALSTSWSLSAQLLELSAHAPSDSTMAAPTVPFKELSKTVQGSLKSYIRLCMDL